MAGALVYTDNPGAIPATYVIPADGELRLSSIVARFNGAGAASAFFPCLSVYSLDGRLVGRFHPKTELAVGDTAVVTYAPFLRSEAAAVAAGAGLGIPDLVLSSGGTIAAHNVWMPIPFEDLSYPATTTLGDVFGATVVDTGDPGNDRWQIATFEEGWYAYELITAWDQVTTGGTQEFGAATQRVSWSGGGGANFGDTDNRDSADWMDIDVHSFFEMVDRPWLHSFRVVQLGGSDTWLPIAKQTTGVDRGLSGQSMKFWYLGADDLSGWTFDFV